MNEYVLVPPNSNQS